MIDCGLFSFIYVPRSGTHNGLIYSGMKHTNPQRPLAGIRLILIGALGLAAMPALAQSPQIQQATELMRKRMYVDAVKILQPIVVAAAEGQRSTELRMLAECHYLLTEYAVARPLFSRALRQQVSEKGKKICESRLAMIAYRLKDYAGALERIESFIRKYPTDKRVGTLLGIRVKLNAAGSGGLQAKITKIEADYRRLSDNVKRYGYYNAALAGKTLGDLYIKAGQDDRAMSLFTRAVHEMRGVVSELKAQRRPIPRDLMQGVDSMALQIAKYRIERKQWNEATKWLENVAHVDHMKWQARLLLAQIAYQRRDYAAVIEALPNDLLRRVPEGVMRSNMHLLLGYAYREGKKADAEAAKVHLKKVVPSAGGYHQAQHGLGEIYGAQNDPTRAETHYLVSVQSTKYAPAAHLALGKIYRQRANALPGADPKSKAARAALTQKAASHFSELIQRFPLTALAAEAKPLLAEMKRAGADVAVTTSAEDNVEVWNRMVRRNPRTSEAAQALLSLAEHHGRRVYDSRGRGEIRAPDWAACGEAAGTIVKAGTTPYSGVTADRWRQIRARAHYLVGRAELGSIPAGPSARRLGERAPTPIPGGGDAARAAKAFNDSLKLSGTDETDFRKDIELGLIEAMFKSVDVATRESAQTRYEARENEYRGDTRYQRMTLALADWYVAQERYESAARAYRRVARKSDLDREEVMHLLYLAGLYFNKAGRKASSADAVGVPRLGLEVYPTQILKSISVLKTHQPFQQVKDIRWSSEAPGPTASEVLYRVSRTFGVPFIWSPVKTSGGVADALAKRRVDPAALARLQQGGRLEEYVRLAVDLDRFGIDFDLGTSGGLVTLSSLELDEFAGKEQIRTVEIFDPKRDRFPTLAKPYGVFETVHADGAMMFNVVERIEELTGSRVFWAEGVDRDDVLAHELREPPGEKTSGCLAFFEHAIEPLGLDVRVIQRDRLVELMAESNDSFNELRRFGMDTAYAERALFNIAVNFYFLKEYEKMKLALREYMKVFDTPSHTHYYEAAYWLGWVFERDRRFREAVRHYSTAAEERVILYKRESWDELIPLEELKKKLSYDTQVGLALKVSGAFDAEGLAERVLPFIRFNTNIEVDLDPAAAAANIQVTAAAFDDLTALEMLYRLMAEYGLGLRVENASPAMAQKAYYRLATVYRKDNRMFEALENVQTLLIRYPQTRRYVEALKLKLDVYKGLKDYGNALDALEQLRRAAKDTIEPYKLDYEAGRIYFDMCDYARAESFYAQAFSGSGGRGEWLKVREALALVYVRQPGKEREALTQYRDLMRYESSKVRQSINRLMMHYLAYMISSEPKRQPLPNEEAAFIKQYEALSDARRVAAGADIAARASWIYYVSALLDLQEGATDAALIKLDAAGNSPDGLLAGDALVRAGRLRMARGDYDAARDGFQHLLFAIKAVEPKVRATFHLARCYEELDQEDLAMDRFEEILKRYPISPYAVRVKQNALYIARTRPADVETPETP